MVSIGYRASWLPGRQGLICIGRLDWLGESRVFRRWGKALPSLPRKTTPAAGSAPSPPTSRMGAADLGWDSAPRRLSVANRERKFRFWKLSR